MNLRARLGLGLTALLLASGCVEEDPNFVFATGSSSGAPPMVTSTSGDGPDLTTTSGSLDSSGGPDTTTDGCVEEVCNGVDDDCDDEVDEGCDCIDGDMEECFTGNPAQQGVGECAPGMRECVGGQWGECVGEVLPVAEQCNSLDDDCDDDIDEDFGQINCGVGICMVTVDVCVDGTPQECVPGDPAPMEECNGFDDDCNGMVDEIMCDCLNGQMQDCYTGPMGTDGVGECSTGTQTCVDGQWGQCVGDQTPVPEACNGLDDDCDGSADDGNPGGGGGCNTGLAGLCSQGTNACVSGAIQCQQTVFPVAEVCDGFDNDCDTGIDESNPGGGAACNTGLQGVCGTGTTLCQGGMLTCTQTVFPSPEVCNGLSDDCDALVDEGNPESGQACSTGLPGACDNGSTTCSGGALQCNQVVFPAAETCNGVDDNCNGTIDDGAVGGGQPCPTGLQGVCGTGVSDCTGGAPACNQTVFPSAEICNGLDDDCNGTVDNGNPGGGGACVTGQPGVCSPGTQQCSGGALQCQPNVPASAEVCDGLDNDCNGSVDNGNPGGGSACNTGQPGVCSPGTTACTGGAIVCNQNVTAGAETCNGLDDDCDGSTDEGNPGSGANCNTGLLGVCAAGTTSCSGGALVCNQNVMAGLEVCNGLDDDCDGLVDEGNPGGGAACNSGQQGVCAAGTTSCTGGALVCNATVAPSPELCDGLDNDCDAIVDEGNPGGGGACNTGMPGVCNAGTTACSGGALVCNQNVAASAEVCDAFDNDCDGLVNEGNPGGGAVCATGQPGICSPGTTSCSGGALVCNQNVMAAAETCNGLDDDCDAVVDEGNPGGGAACNTGMAGVCNPGTTACSAGAIVCNQNVAAGAEACNGLDDDCDGISDEGNPGGGAACNTGIPGVCSPGTTACAGGALVCNQNVAASPEVCDAVDNDCDGLVNEGNPGGGASCNTGLQGACAAGTTACSGGAITCNQNVAAVAEICANVIDDDCDGQVDEGCGFGFDSGYTGYQFMGAPPCDDIAATGTPTNLTDDSHVVVPIGFTFPVYGSNFNNVAIQSNGALHFATNTYMGLTNSCLPTATVPTDNNVYVFWDDLNPGAAAGTNVYYQTIGAVGSRRFVVQWETAHFAGSTADLIRVQAMLHEATGYIEVCYPDTLSAGNVGDNGAEATSGIQQNSMGALQFSCDMPSLVSGLWLRYIPF